MQQARFSSNIANMPEKQLVRGCTLLWVLGSYEQVAVREFYITTGAQLKVFSFVPAAAVRVCSSACVHMHVHVCLCVHVHVNASPQYMLK